MRGARRFGAALLALVVTVALLVVYVFSSSPVNRIPGPSPSPAPTLIDQVDVI